MIRTEQYDPKPRPRLRALVIQGALGVVLAGALLTACGDDDSGPGDGAPAGDPGGDSGSPPVVEVTDQGGNPRQQLRLSPEAGREATATMKLGMQIEGSIDGQTLPSQEVPEIQFTMAMTVEDATSERIDTTFSYEDVSVGSGADPQTASSIEGTLEGFVGTTGSLSTTATGQLLEAELDLSEDVDPTLRAFTAQIEEQFRSITVPFPEEPVGPGASWTVDSDFEISGVTSQIHATYTLEQLRGDQYELAVDLEQTTEPGVFEDGSGEVLSGETTGSGTLQGRLDALFPVRSQATTDGTMIIEVETEEGQAQELEQKIGVDLTFTSPVGGGG